MPTTAEVVEAAFLGSLEGHDITVDYLEVTPVGIRLAHRVAGEEDEWDVCGRVVEAYAYLPEGLERARNHDLDVDVGPPVERSLTIVTILEETNQAAEWRIEHEWIGGEDTPEDLGAISDRAEGTAITPRPFEHVCSSVDWLPENETGSGSGV